MPSLLVVDDEPGVRESLRMLFKGDCEVATASTVEEAEQFLQGSNPDLILLDLVMPGRGGLDLLASLADEVDPPPVVVLTATKTVATAVEAMKHGATTSPNRSKWTRCASRSANCSSGATWSARSCGCARK